MPQKLRMPGALNVLASSLLFNNRNIIFDRVATLRLPARGTRVTREWRSRAVSSATGH